MTGGYRNRLLVCFAVSTLGVAQLSAFPGIMVDTSQTQAVADARRAMETLGGAVPAIRQCHVDLSTSAERSTQPAEDASDRAAETLRSVALTIEQCPEVIESETRWGKGPLEVSREYIGPFRIIVRDVVPNDSDPSRQIGYIEFSASHRRWVAPETKARYDSEHPFQLQLQDGDPRYFRYEFDIGPFGLEHERVLTRTGDERLWFNVGREEICLDDAARADHSIAITEYSSRPRTTEPTGRRPEGPTVTIPPPPAVIRRH